MGAPEPLYVVQRRLERRGNDGPHPGKTGQSLDLGIVLDPFIGSGTTATVARRLGRDWLGIELNNSYADAATDRIKDAA